MDLQNEHSQASETSEPTGEPARQWCALNRVQRRVVGVLVEKSKTTPDVYPMTVNSIRTAANQKSNRKPKMDLENDDVEDTLLELRHLGAVVEVISDGRVPKYKHKLYEWLNVEKKELAVMAELLLRGEQTLGDLRARASRMNQIADQNELKEILRSLLDKELVVELTPPGRGQIVTHGLYREQEMDKVRRNNVHTSEPESASEPAAPAEPGQMESLVQRIEALEQRVNELQQEIDEIKS